MTTQGQVSTVVNCVSLKASHDSHSSHISQAISSLIHVATYVRIISSSGESVLANGSLLCLTSPYICDLLASVPCCTSPTIILSDCSTHAIKHFINIITKGFTTSHLSNGIFKDINGVMDIAKLLNISLMDITYEEEGPPRSENNGANDDQHADEIIDIKEEIVDNIDFDESYKSIETDEDINKEKSIIGISKNASLFDTVSSLTKMSTSQVKRLDTHSSEELFPCEVCGKTFKLMTTLEFHKVSHGNLPSPKVNKNGKSLTEAFEKYSCPVCPSSYVRKENLNKHMNIHTGLKPYTCPNCTKAFTTKLMKKNHLRKCILEMVVETKDKNDMIEKQLENGLANNKGKPNVEHVSFSESIEVSLDVPNQNSAKSKTYDCPYCNSKYYSIGGKNMHIKKKHPENVSKVKSRVDKEIVGNIANPKCNVGNKKRHTKKKHPEGNSEATNKCQDDSESQENKTNDSLLVHKCN